MTARVTLLEVVVRVPCVLLSMHLCWGGDWEDMFCHSDNMRQATCYGIMTRLGKLPFLRAFFLFTKLVLKDVYARLTWTRGATSLLDIQER